MKKLLIVAMVCALFAPAFAVENVKVTGDIQTIGFSVEDPAAQYYGDFKGITNRVILGIGADLVEDVYAKVTFAHENVFGDYLTANTLGGIFPTNTLVGESMEEAWTRIHVAEAFVKISNIFDALELKVGRQYYGDEKSAVMYFGPTYGYADPVRVVYGSGFAPSGSTYEIFPSYLSLDGATATYRGETFTLTAAYFAVENDSWALDRDSELSIAGLDLETKINENIAANAYIYDVKDNGMSPLFGDSFGFWGVKPTFEYEHFKLGAEYTRNYGLGNDKGWQVKADLAIPLSVEDTMITPRATYLKSEKHFQALGNYRPGLMFGTLLGAPVNNIIATNMYGFAPVNWEILNIGLCMKFANLEKWGFGLDFYTGEADGDFQGNSWEAKVVYNVNQYVALNLTGALLTNAGHSWKHSANAVQLGMNIKF